MQSILFAVMLTSIFVSRGAIAEDYDCACNHCGCCDQHVRKVCRVKCEMKDVKTTKYGMVCEDYCLPGHGEKCGCQHVPSCGCVRTKHKLTKFEEVKKVPTYKCVVEYLCDNCCHACGAAPMNEEPEAAPMEDETSPPPVPAETPAPPSARRPFSNDPGVGSSARLPSVRSCIRQGYNVSRPAGGAARRL